MRWAPRITKPAVAAAPGVVLAAFIAWMPADASSAARTQAPAGSDAPATTPGAHVDVSAKPAVVLSGQHVVIAGSTVYSAKQHQASVRVRHESGTPAVTLSAAVSPNGQFNVTFADTKKGGKYQVTVTAPDGKGSGATAFRVDSIATLAGEVEKLSGELDQRTKKLLTFLHETASSLPASAERDQLVASAQKLQQRADAVHLTPAKMLAELEKLVPQPNAAGTADPTIFQGLRDWVPEAEAAIEQIDTARIGEKPTPLCETMNTAIEGAKFASYAFSISKSLLTTLGKIAVDKGVPTLVEKLGFQGATGTSLSYNIKVAADGFQGAVGGITTAITGLTDFVELGIKSMFDRYCGSFDGPLSVSMTMVWNEGSQPWLKYGVRLDGRFRLRFPKNSPPGKPVYLTGELEGNATNFTFWEDVTVAEPLPRGILVLERRWLAPIPFKNSTASPVDFGMVARTITPAYFNVPVIGEMTGDTIKMQFKEARVDFTPVVKNRLLFVVMTPLMPDYKLFTFPIQKAHWILSKGFSDPTTFTVVGTGAQRGIRLARSTSHRETANKSVVVDWVIDVDARKSAEGK